MLLHLAVATVALVGPHHASPRRCAVAMTVPPADAFPPRSFYDWRGHRCAYVAAGDGPPVLLLHGFAGSAYNAWRSTIPALARTHRVYALDLLGLGASAQPADVEYGISLWREQAEDFMSEVMVADGQGAAPVVIGHSFGSVIALELAARGQQPVGGVAMMNCGEAHQPCRRAPARRAAAHTPAPAHTRRCGPMRSRRGPQQ